MPPRRDSGGDSWQCSNPACRDWTWCATSSINCFRCGAPKPEGAGAEYGERQDQGGYDRGGPPPGEAPPRDISVDEYRSSGRSAQELADSLTREQR